MKRRLYGHECGTAVPSQYQLTARSTQYVGSGGGLGLRPFPVEIKPEDWTADTTDYPDAAELGNITLYRADARHNLGSEHALAIALQHASGLFANERIQFQTTEDPANPGYKRNNVSRVWISSDAPPSSPLFLLFI
ncbi:MAG TPA: hypothetical protein PK916_04620 [Bacteroidota bacterium]|nr:hypothetical protein [Bacteroidota bacterium]